MWHRPGPRFLGPVAGGSDFDGLPQGSEHYAEKAFNDRTNRDWWSGRSRASGRRRWERS
jgi:hypothetical protein